MGKIIGGTTTTPMRMTEPSGGGEKEWELLEDITLGEAVTQVDIPKEKLKFKEVHIEALIVPSDKTINSQAIQIFTGGANIWNGTSNPKATGKLYFVADLYLSADKKVFCDGNLSAYYYNLTGTSFKGLEYFFMNDSYKRDYISSAFNAYLIFKSSTADGLAAGTRIKIWGR